MLSPHPTSPATLLASRFCHSPCCAAHRLAAMPFASFVSRQALSLGGFVSRRLYYPPVLPPLQAQHSPRPSFSIYQLSHPPLPVAGNNAPVCPPRKVFTPVAGNKHPIRPPRRKRRTCRGVAQPDQRQGGRSATTRVAAKRVHPCKKNRETQTPPCFSMIQDPHQLAPSNFTLKTWMPSLYFDA